MTAQLIPHTSPGPWPADLHPSRFAAHVKCDSPKGCKAAILGIPDDLGVRLNGGRPGAVGGPWAVRDALCRYGVAEPAGWTWPGLFDAGNIVPAEGDDEKALAETHRRVTEATAAILDLNLFPIAIGGGHDLTFPFVRAVAARAKGGSMAGVFFDPHLDVRESPGSGMGMRRLIDECQVKPLLNVGFNPLVNTKAHYDWFMSKGGFFRPTPTGQWPEFGKSQFVSVDMDSIDSSQVPGVSALNPAGLWAGDIAHALVAAGRCNWVTCFDIMELNPVYDLDGRSARIAAHLLLSFLRGLSERRS